MITKIEQLNIQLKKAKKLYSKMFHKRRWPSDMFNKYDFNTNTFIETKPIKGSFSFKFFNLENQIENLKGQITTEKALNPEIYHLNFNREFKITIKERDDYTCQICGSKERLCIHHINYDKSNDCSNPKDFLTTCIPCNSSLNANRPQQTKRCKQIIKLKRYIPT